MLEIYDTIKNYGKIILKIRDSNNTKYSYSFICDIFDMSLYNMKGGKGHAIFENKYSNIEEYRNKNVSLVITDDIAILTDTKNIKLKGDKEFINELHQTIDKYIYSIMCGVNEVMLMEVYRIINESIQVNTQLTKYICVDILSNQFNHDIVHDVINCIISEEKFLAYILEKNNYAILEKIKISDMIDNAVIINILSNNEIVTIKDYFRYIQKNKDISKINGIGKKYKLTLHDRLKYIMYLL